MSQAEKPFLILAVAAQSALRQDALPTTLGRADKRAAAEPAQPKSCPDARELETTFILALNGRELSFAYAACDEAERNDDLAPYTARSYRNAEGYGLTLITKNGWEPDGNHDGASSEVLLSKGKDWIGQFGEIANAKLLSGQAIGVGPVRVGDAVPVRATLRAAAVKGAAEPAKGVSYKVGETCAKGLTMTFLSNPLPKVSDKWNHVDALADCVDFVPNYEGGYCRKSVPTGESMVTRWVEVGRIAYENDDGLSASQKLFTSVKATLRDGESAETASYELGGYNEGAARLFTMAETMPADIIEDSLLARDYGSDFKGFRKEGDGFPNMAGMVGPFLSRYVERIKLKADGCQDAVWAVRQ